MTGSTRQRIRFLKCWRKTRSGFDQKIKIEYLSLVTKVLSGAQIFEVHGLFFHKSHFVCKRTVILVQNQVE
jgi:hypothetical protein